MPSFEPPRPDGQAKNGLPSVTPDFVEQNFPDEIDNVVPTHGYQQTPMVGLGGSAGSIQALTAFFQAMPPDTGMVFVVVLHLSPAHESTLAELLGRSTKMTVIQALDKQKVEPDHVYVIPPGKYMTSVNGHLRLTDLEGERGKRVAVDLFFRSLADTHGSHALAIILSGADSDGALGIRRIKERGGLTIAQDPEEAEYPGMPRSAIDTGMVDWVLDVADIPARLVEYQANESKLKLPPEEGPPLAPVAKPTLDDSESALRDVLLFLRMRTGRDFSYYKRATILRRIARRMQVNGIQDLPSYLAFLSVHPGEAGALLKDLLISVTNFFRDRETFEKLGEHVPKLFADKHQADSLRVWVPACATGEEAYSIAILLLEHARKLDNPPLLQVFACDLDREAIQIARAGQYPGTITADVSEDRLNHFFVKDRRGYRVKRELREMVLFAEHDLLKDAPFSRMDTISCRNLLIYLNREAQRRAFDIFHFALKPEGLLFLGLSEAVDDDSPLFRVVDKKNRIYAPKLGPRAGLPVPSGPSTLLRAIEEHERSQAPVVHGKGFVQEAAVPFRDRLRPLLDRATLAELHFRLVEQLGPPSVIINEDQDIMHLSEHAGEFLKLSGGEPTMNLLRVVLPALRVELRSAIFRARETNSTVESFNIPVELDGKPASVSIRVAPAHDIASNFMLVAFEKKGAPADSAAQCGNSAGSEEPALRQLERELEQANFRLRDTVERYEASTEELKASNEELQAMNEELRSATEELETSREELQSINEELTTVNSEMKGKMDELAHANSDLQNLMASTAIATIFLDRDLAITRYTPTAVELFNLIPTDIGRPLSDLKQEFDYPELLADAGEVLKTLVPSEREVRDAKRWFLARLQPYRTAEDHIAGVVLNFIDITERKNAERDLAADLRDMVLLRKVSEQLIPEGQMQSFFETILDAAVGLMRADAGTLQLLDPSSGVLHLISAHEVPADFAEHFAKVDASSSSACGKALASGRRVFVDFDEAGPYADESNKWVLKAGFISVQATPLISRSGRTIGMFSTHWRSRYRPHDRELRFLDLLARQAADAIERKQSGEALRASEQRLQLVIKCARDFAIFTIDPERRINTWNPGAEAVFGYSEQEILGQLSDVLFTPEDRAKGDHLREIQLAKEEGRAENERWHTRKNGTIFYGSGSIMPLRDKDETLRGFVKIMRDLTERKRTQEELKQQVDELKRFNDVAVGRETRMIELKKEINELCARLKEQPRYKLEFEGDDKGNH